MTCKPEARLHSSYRSTYDNLLNIKFLDFINLILHESVMNLCYPNNNDNLFILDNLLLIRSSYTDFNRFVTSGQLQESSNERIQLQIEHFTSKLVIFNEIICKWICPLMIRDISEKVLDDGLFVCLQDSETGRRQMSLNDTLYQIINDRLF